MCVIMVICHRLLIVITTSELIELSFVCLNFELYIVCGFCVLLYVFVAFVAAAQHDVTIHNLL